MGTRRGENGRIVLERVHGEQNPADHLTKTKSRRETKRILETVGAELVETERRTVLEKDHEVRQSARKSWADLQGRKKWRGWLADMKVGV